MATTKNLQYQRYIRQVSLGSAMSKYSYRQMQRSLDAKLRESAWRMASAPWQQVQNPINKVTEGSGLENNPYVTYIDDRYDAYKQGGDASLETGRMCAYAGVVCYRLYLPEKYDWGSTGKVSVPVSTDRYLRGGVRIAWALSNDPNGPAEDWSTIRNGGDGVQHTDSDTTGLLDGVSSWGFASQKGVEWTISSQPQNETWEFSLAAGSGNDWKYLDVFLTLEDPEEVWVDYDEANPRWYSIEGAATISGRDIAVTFESVTASGLVGAYALALSRGSVAPTGWMYKHFGPFPWIANATAVFVDPNLPYWKNDSQKWSYWPKYIWTESSTPSSVNILDSEQMDIKAVYDKDLNVCAPYCSTGTDVFGPKMDEVASTLTDETVYRPTLLPAGRKNTNWCGYTVSTNLGDPVNPSDGTGPTTWKWGYEGGSEHLKHTGTGVAVQLHTAALFAVQGQIAGQQMHQLGVKVQQRGLNTSGATSGFLADGLRVNIWASRSRNACSGPWQHAVAGCLMTKMAAYGDGSEDLVVSLNGTGDLSKSTALIATWEYVGSFSVTGSTRSTDQLVVSSKLPLEAGMVLAFVPVVTGGITAQELDSTDTKFEVGCTLLEVVVAP